MHDGKKLLCKQRPCDFSMFAWLGAEPADRFQSPSLCNDGIHKNLNAVLIIFLSSSAVEEVSERKTELHVA